MSILKKNSERIFALSSVISGGALGTTIFDSFPFNRTESLQILIAAPFLDDRGTVAKVVERPLANYLTKFSQFVESSGNLKNVKIKLFLLSIMHISLKNFLFIFGILSSFNDKITFDLAKYLNSAKIYGNITKLPSLNLLFSFCSSVKKSGTFELFGRKLGYLATVDKLV